MWNLEEIKNMKVKMRLSGIWERKKWSGVGDDKGK
jgi:hypothetical protein